MYSIGVLKTRKLESGTIRPGCNGVLDAREIEVLGPNSQTKTPLSPIPSPPFPLLIAQEQDLPHPGLVGIALPAARSNVFVSMFLGQGLCLETYCSECRKCRLQLSTLKRIEGYFLLCEEKGFQNSVR